VSGSPDEEEDSSRRRVLALLAAALLALLGAGTGNLFGGSDDGDDDGGPDLSVDYSVTPDESAPTPTPTPDPAPSSSGDDGTPVPDDADDPPEQSDTTTGGSESDASTTDAPRRFDDPDDDPRSNAPEAAPGTETPTDTPGSDLVTSSIPPVSVSDVEPGDGGVVDLSLTLSGSPARLWVRGTVTDSAERGIVEPERSAGDTSGPGELQEYVAVRLWYDADSNGAVSDGDNLVYEGTLADLNGLDGQEGWIPLTAACMPPGTHTARFRWDLPEDAPNTVQTDSVSFSLSVAADASACE